MELLNYRETAKMLRVSERTMRKLVRENKIPFVRIGRAVRFNRAAIEALGVPQ